MPDYAEDVENYVGVLESVDQKEKLGVLFQETQIEDNNRAKHLINQERWFKKRFGIRPQIVTWPWRGASNLHLPLTDKTIRRAKPNYANLIGATYPTVCLESNRLGDDQMLLRGVERHFNELLLDNNKMNCFLPLCWGIDLMMEKGRFITKVIQEFKPQIVHEEIHVNKLSQEMQEFLKDPHTSDSLLAQELSLQYDMDLKNEDDLKEILSAIKQYRAGQNVVKFQREVNLTPHPTLVVRNPLSVLFPNDTNFFISKAKWIRDRIAVQLIDIEQRAESNIWDPSNTKELLRRLDANETGRASQQTPIVAPNNLIIEETREGVSPGRNNDAVVDEYFIWKKMPGERLPQRMVLTVHPNHTDLPLRLIKYPYITPEGVPEDWCFDQVQFEIVHERALSPRGYPQLLDSLQTELTNNHNAKQNYMTIANSLNLKCKRNANIGTHWVPGQPLYVNRMDDVQELTLGQRDMSFDNEERILKSWAEEYVGILDQTLTNQSGIPERRTKAEIQEVSALQAQVSGLDVRIFQGFMERPYNRIWNRYMQYGPDEISFLDANGQPISVKKVDLKQRFRPKPYGNINTNNRQMKSSRMWAMAEKVMPLPFANTFEIMRDCLAMDDERISLTWITRPEQVNQNQIERFIKDIMMINEGYDIVPRPDDDDKIAMAVVQDYLKDPVKSRNLKPDRLIAVKNYYEAHKMALEKKTEATTRGGRAQQEIAKVAHGASEREARKTV